MAGNNDIPNGLNKIAENEYNYSETSDREINDLSEEFSVAADNSSAGVREYASLKGKTETVAGAVGGVAAQSTATTEAVKTLSGNTSVLYRIVMSLAAVFGALVIGTTASGARAENARFITVETYDIDVYMQIEVLKWSENLKVRITGKDFTDYLYIDNYEEDADYPNGTADGQGNGFWLYYCVEGGEDGDTILLEIIGETVLMSDVIDSKTVVLKFDVPQEPDNDYPINDYPTVDYPTIDYPAGNNDFTYIDNDYENRA